MKPLDNRRCLALSPLWLPFVSLVCLSPTVELVIPSSVEDFAASCYFVRSNWQGPAGNLLLVSKGAGIWTVTVPDPTPKGICRASCDLRPPIFVHQKPLEASRRNLKTATDRWFHDLKFGGIGSWKVDAPTNVIQNHVIHGMEWNWGSILGGFGRMQLWQQTMPSTAADRRVFYEACHLRRFFAYMLKKKPTSVEFILHLLQDIMKGFLFIRRRKVKIFMRSFFSFIVKRLLFFSHLNNYFSLICNCYSIEHQSGFCRQWRPCRSCSNA